MTEEKGKTGEGRTLHLEVVDAQTVILECFNLLIKFRVGKWGGTEFRGPEVRRNRHRLW